MSENIISDDELIANIRKATPADEDPQKKINRHIKRFVIIRTAQIAAVSIVVYALTRPSKTKSNDEIDPE